MSDISIHSLVKRETYYNYSKGESQKISIHSLVKRETACQALDILSNFISIHSLVKRETKSPVRIFAGSQNFNPLPRKEGDPQVRLITSTPAISIHSLVKRETMIVQ